MEELREAWFNAKDPAESKQAAEAVQRRAFEFVPFVPTGQFILPTAFRSNISGVIIAPVSFLWNVEKK
jgi:peptide/nickel transport system substrate-binding protein